jgi:hypothetical protein
MLGIVTTDDIIDTIVREQTESWRRVSCPRRSRWALSLGVIGVCRIGRWQRVQLYDDGPHHLLITLSVGAALVDVRARDLLLHRDRRPARHADVTRAGRREGYRDERRQHGD